MTETFADMLGVGGKSNSLGRTNEVIELVLADRDRLPELYDCLFEDDAWLRMRAADALEKICRQHPDWLVPYVDRLLHDFASSTQPSILWHLAQILAQVELSEPQKRAAIAWLKTVLASKDVDWIVAANAMDTLVHFAVAGWLPVAQVVPLLRVQQGHKSAAVVKRATKLLAQLAAE
jgi:hypothetical protein